MANRIDDKLEGMLALIACAGNVADIPSEMMKDFLEVDSLDGLTKAVTYTRFSSDNQNENSILGQCRSILEYVKANKIVLTKIFKDEAISGTHERRPSYQMMLETIEKNIGTKDDIDMVIIYKTDRQSRNLYSAIDFEKFMKKNRKAIYSVTEPTIYKEELSSEMYKYMSYIMNQEFSRNLSRLVKRGLKESVLKSYKEFGMVSSIGGIPLYGYDIDPVTRQPTINANEAVAVRKVFSMMAEGNTYKTVLQYLRDNGFRTKKGNEFGQTSLHDLLINPRYKGLVVFQGRADRIKNKHGIAQITDDMIVLENAWPSIIDEETFAIVGERMKSRMLESRKVKHTYLLTGLMKCGECGFSFNGCTSVKSDKKRNKSYTSVFYRCAQGRSGGKEKCCNVGLRKEEIEGVVIDIVKKALLQANSVSKITDFINKFNLEKTRHINDEIENFERKIADWDLKISKAIDMLLDGNLNDVTKKALNVRILRFETEKMTFIKQRESEGKSLSKAEEFFTTEEKVREVISSLNFDEKNQNDLKYILRRLIDEIVITKENVEVRMNFSIFLLSKTQKITTVIVYPRVCLDGRTLSFFLFRVQKCNRSVAPLLTRNLSRNREIFLFVSLN